MKPLSYPKVTGGHITDVIFNDPGNPAHDLCDDCLLRLPQNPDQRYPEKTAQISGMDTGGIS